MNVATLSPTELDKAFFTGLLEGEGSYCLVMNTRGYFYPRIDFTNNFYELHEWVHVRWGGSCKQHSKHKAFSTYWQSRADCEKILIDVLPYSVAKKIQVELLLESLPLRHTSKRTIEIAAILRLIHRGEYHAAERSSTSRELPQPAGGGVVHGHRDAHHPNGGV